MVSKSSNFGKSESLHKVYDLGIIIYISEFTGPEDLGQFLQLINAKALR